ncbi:MAG: hypothetical protein QOH87_108 [Trebonia sp.]|jgi:hypothetical protein|nr:gvpG [Actinomycetes bacterium]MDX6339970.1 hypothetical protein [Trebonia sp.]MDX6416616.1 hypothetical protein [Trebonia sp.]
MEPLTALFRLPFLPLQGVIKLGELIQDEADRQLHDPARIRHELDEAQRRYEAGEISDEEFTQIQDELVGTEVAPPSVPATSEDRS